ncbi:magnesium and cobalt transport protein CorA [Rothia terrae]|jgi:magnesium transporter|uniref:magnesium and cobalt transport protein CorA n=1 Tax=Rothia terrae TaxID=396015 RepID=UPI0014468E93|nr:magnesium and cobalt transport protein CorA [Rothia terrae]MDT0189609.1 magnesium and cobalt transport protein CorA [Rothia terrae]NKZ33634.1 magnesium and cobalt transport protein CorA [Rothia terrae]
MSLLLNKVARIDGPIEEIETLAELETKFSADSDDRAFIGLLDPTHDDLQLLTRIFDLHELAVEDSEHGHQRAKLDRYGSTYFLVLRPTVYLDETEEVRFGETHMFVGKNFVIWLVKDALRSQEKTRKAMQDAFQEALDEEGRPVVPLVFLHRVLDSLVDSYFPVIEGLENDGDEVEDTLFADNSEASEISQRTYGLLNEVSDFKRAVKPVGQMLDILMGRIRILAKAEDNEEQVELIRRFRDVNDHVLHVNDRVDDLRNSLENALAVNSTIVAERQNDDMKRISAWAAILVAPTIIGSIYGMNFDDMPELHWAFGYPASLTLMVLVSFGLWVVFKRKEWL